MMFKGKQRLFSFLTVMAIMLFLMVPMAFAGEADIVLPDLSKVTFMDGALSGMLILNLGLAVCIIGMAFGWMQYSQTKALPAHQAMLDVSQTIWETCKTYVLQQGKFLAALWILIAICIVYYFGVLSHMEAGDIMVVLVCSILGILGSYGVAWFGIRINTVANSRAAFASMSGEPLNIVNICLRSGMSVGLLLVSIELFFMILILAYIPSELAGPSFIGFAIGESLGASALRICGGIFTKIADIGSDLMKIIFHLPEDDP
ncbi:MAG TPA: sodium/proton-translocating pyrophosphatase, partial [Syntrophales bacterium]|nr:sodium/proton-translocating pyrophosphatase [Syntrophales bacterium]